MAFAVPSGSLFSDLSCPCSLALACCAIRPPCRSVDWRDGRARAQRDRTALSRSVRVAPRVEIAPASAAGFAALALGRQESRIGGVSMVIEVAAVIGGLCPLADAVR